MKKKIHEGRAGTDVAYWESLLVHLQVHMAKGRIRKRHSQMLQYRLQKIREEQTAEAEQQDSSDGEKQTVNLLEETFPFLRLFLFCSWFFVSL